MDRETLERFWSKVDRSNGEDACWNWTGATTNHGYGIFSISHNKHIHANRYALIVSGINVPDGYYACHTCDNRRCSNPKHLFVGTASDNEQDKIQKGRHCYKTRKGEQSNFAKLNTAQVEEIRSSSLPRRTLAENFGVHVATINRIKKGKLWK